MKHWEALDLRQVVQAVCVEKLEKGLPHKPSGIPSGQLAGYVTDHVRKGVAEGQYPAHWLTPTKGYRDVKKVVATSVVNRALAQCPEVFDCGVQATSWGRQHVWQHVNALKAQEAAQTEREYRWGLATEAIYVRHRPDRVEVIANEKLAAVFYVKQAIGVILNGEEQFAEVMSAERAMASARTLASVLRSVYVEALEAQAQ